MTIITLKPSSPAAIPEVWRGPACAMFDLQMAERLDAQHYDKAARLASMLAHYDEMSFEPSKREQAILDAQRQTIEEAQQWVLEHVLLNPLIKKLMFETVRDLGRETGDPEADKARSDYLAEMESSN